MNLYVVVEGKCGEKKVYPHWIKYLNNSMTQVYSLDEIHDNNFYIISGYGYPQYLSIIDDAIQDVKNHNQIDYLVVCVDSEDKSFQDKYNEIEVHMDQKIELNKIKIVIQHPCLEVWALGNKLLIKRNPQSLELRKYINLYNVRKLDPEGLPNNELEGLNRCQFAYQYLRKALNEVNPYLSYSKSNPKVIIDESYFHQIIKRFRKDSHIQSLKTLISAFE